MAVASGMTISVVTAPRVVEGPDPAVAPPSTTYYQRVRDTGEGGRWCYYSSKSINASPLSGDTTPNWSGAISAHSVIATVTV